MPELTYFNLALKYVGTCINITIPLLKVADGQLGTQDNLRLEVDAISKTEQQ